MSSHLSRDAQQLNISARMAARNEGERVSLMNPRTFASERQDSITGTIKKSRNRSPSPNRHLSEATDRNINTRPVSAHMQNESNSKNTAQNEEEYFEEDPTGEAEYYQWYAESEYRKPTVKVPLQQKEYVRRSAVPQNYAQVLPETSKLRSYVQYQYPTEYTIKQPQYPNVQNVHHNSYYPTYEESYPIQTPLYRTYQASPRPKYYHIPTKITTQPQNVYYVQRPSSSPVYSNPIPSKYYYQAPQQDLLYRRVSPNPTMAHAYIPSPRQHTYLPESIIPSLPKHTDMQDINPSTSFDPPCRRSQKLNQKYIKEQYPMAEYNLPTEYYVIPEDSPHLIQKRQEKPKTIPEEDECTDDENPIQTQHENTLYKTDEIMVNNNNYYSLRPESKNHQLDEQKNFNNNDVSHRDFENRIEKQNDLLKEQIKNNQNIVTSNEPTQREDPDCSNLKSSNKSEESTEKAISVLFICGMFNSSLNLDTEMNRPSIIKNAMESNIHPTQRRQFQIDTDSLQKIEEVTENEQSEYDPNKSEESLRNIINFSSDTDLTTFPKTTETNGKFYEDFPAKYSHENIQTTRFCNIQYKNNLLPNKNIEERKYVKTKILKKKHILSDDSLNHNKFMSKLDQIINKIDHRTFNYTDNMSVNTFKNS